MKSFHFDFGNSNTGVLGMCARVLAESKEDSVKILRDKIESLDLGGCHGVDVVDDNDPGSPDDSEPHVEYLQVYINPDRIGVGHIDEVNDPDTGDEFVETA